MARPLRIQFSGAIYHVTTRGNARNHIFRDDSDRFRFLDSLGNAVQRFRWLCHAYCLMDNHYHLLVETPNANLSKGMHLLNGDYTNRFNKRHDTVGHIFQGRYKAILVNRDSHLLELCRYIVLNPLRAGMVSDPANYHWSSYQATMGRARPQEWLHMDWVLSQFGMNRAQAQNRYERFVNAGGGLTSIWSDVQGGLLLGSKAFLDSVASKVEGLVDTEEVSKSQRLLNRPGLSSVLPNTSYWPKAVRNGLILEAYLKHEYTMKAIAEHLGLHYSTISKVIKSAGLK